MRSRRIWRGHERRRGRLLGWRLMQADRAVVLGVIVPELEHLSVNPRRPQSGFSFDSRWITSRTSASTIGRPGRRLRFLRRLWSHQPSRCQPMEFLVGTAIRARTVSLVMNPEFSNLGSFSTSLSHGRDTLRLLPSFATGGLPVFGCFQPRADWRSVLLMASAARCCVPLITRTRSTVAVAALAGGCG